MVKFKVSKITLNSETISKRLTQAREEKEISLVQASADLKINIKYLEALENWNLSALPSGVYVKNYLRAYAEYLLLPINEIMEQYESEYGEKKIDANKGLFVQKVTKARYFFSIPRVLKISAIILAVLVCVIYIGFYLNNIVSAPKLIILYPADDLTTTDKKITLSGLSDTEASIKINGEEVLTDKEGYFSDEITLKNGLNVIQIVAQKKYSQKKEIIRNILVNEEK